MAAKPARDPQTRAVNLRMREDLRGLIDRAAKAHGKSRSDFMIEAARRAAEDALLDQTLIRIDPDSHQHYLDILDRAPDSDGFRRLMQARPPWRT
ncbi:DUF1778 domain-containing protein [Methylobacterium oryzihabitans]|uniref:DUF1778 domain-containing protein n=1 Tax=Methylobacterium oryzihabitans TaxID=2499852 RepID=A0A3S2YLP5_9HYPH|nr:DUF1778 domain-containing protein [Methylobacterium oryzihabitans]RVU13977.1 DUF1778 domain-containing protein [Methylobacterium oryzihabitans]